MQVQKEEAKSIVLPAVFEAKERSVGIQNREATQEYCDGAAISDAFVRRPLCRRGGGLCISNRVIVVYSLG